MTCMPDEVHELQSVREICNDLHGGASSLFADGTGEVHSVLR